MSTYYSLDSLKSNLFGQPFVPSIHHRLLIQRVRKSMDSMAQCKQPRYGYLTTGIAPGNIPHQGSLSGIHASAYFWQWSSSLGSNGPALPDHKSSCKPSPNYREYRSYGTTYKRDVLLVGFDSSSYWVADEASAHSVVLQRGILFCEGVVANSTRTLAAQALAGRAGRWRGSRGERLRSRLRHQVGEAA